MISNNHLIKYLTHESKHLRNWVKERIPRTDQRFIVIEGNIDYIPEEHTYVYGEVYISNQNLKSLNRKVIYCEALYCFHNQLIKLPDLPVCVYLDCTGNQLIQLPNLPACKYLHCRENKSQPFQTSQYVK